MCIYVYIYYIHTHIYVIHTYTYIYTCMYVSESVYARMYFTVGVKQLYLRLTQQPF